MKKTLAGALREGAWWLAAAAAAAAGIVFVWPETADSVRTSWVGMAGGAENVRGWTGVAVWEAARGTISPRSPLPFRIAETGAAYHVWLLGLALVWAGGTRRLARSAGCGPAAAAAAGIVSGPLALVVGAGRHAMLEAAAFPWLVGGLAGGAAGALAAPVIALGLLSPEGIRLALPLIIVAALRRDGSAAARWGPAALAVGMLFALPEPEWARFLRFETPATFAGGSYAWPERSLPETLRLVATGRTSPGAAASLAALVLGAAALTGMTRARRPPVWIGLVAMGLVGIALGETSVEEAFAGVASPASVLALVFPGVRLHALPDVAACVTGPLLLALAFRVPTVAVAALVCIASAAAWDLPAAPAPAPVPERVVAAIGTGRQDTLALPLTIANDRRWRSALPGEATLLNGTQRILAANAPLLARELAETGPRGTRRILRKLGIDRVAAPPARAAALGAVIERGETVWLVRSKTAGSDAATPRCLPPQGWTLRSSVGNPAVSVVARAVDGDPATRWGSGAPQRPGQFFEIDFGRTIALARLELGHEEFPTDHPRGFRVLVSGRNRDGLRETLVRDPYLGEPKWRGSFLYEAPDGRVRLPLGERRIRRVRVELTRAARLHDWSITSICAVPAADRKASPR